MTLEVWVVDGLVTLMLKKYEIVAQMVMVMDLQEVENSVAFISLKMSHFNTPETLVSREPGILSIVHSLKQGQNTITVYWE